MDEQIGRLMGFMRESGLIDRTLIIFTSDHGEQLGDHWLLGKGGYFDASYHIPLIIRDPRQAADAGRGAVVSSFTENVDIMPTMLDAIGPRSPPVRRARIWRRLSGARAPATWRDAAHWEYDFRDVTDDAAKDALGLTPTSAR